MSRKERFLLRSFGQHPPEDTQTGVVEGTRTEENKETKCETLYEFLYNGVYTERNIIVAQYTEATDIFCEKQTDISTGVRRIHLQYVSAARSHCPL